MDQSVDKVKKKFLFRQMLQLTDVFGQLENICIFLVSEQLLADGVVKLRQRAGKLEIQIWIHT